MPVHEYTTMPPGFWKLGTIRKGDTKQVEKTDPKTGKKYTVDVPIDLDHFRVTFMPGKKSKELEAAFRAAYGDKPTELNVRFNGIHTSDFWDVNFVCYRQGGQVARAGSNENGLYWIFYRDQDSMEVLVRDGSPTCAEGRAFMDTPIDLSKPIYYNSKNEPQCLKLEGRLEVVIPELKHLAVGYFEFVPKSPRDLRNISSEIAAYAEVAKNFGKTLNGVPFVLLRREEEVPKNINGKLSYGPSWVVHLTASGEYGKRALDVIERMALPDIVEGEVTEVSEGPEWDAGFDEPPVPETPQIPAKVPTESIKVTPPAPTTPALPHSREALMKIFADEYNAARLKKIDAKLLPSINPKMTPEQITEAIQGLRAAVAAAGA